MIKEKSPGILELTSNTFKELPIGSQYTNNGKTYIKITQLEWKNMMDGITRNLKEQNLIKRNYLLDMKIEKIQADAKGMTVQNYRLYVKDIKKYKDELTKKIEDL